MFFIYFYVILCIYTYICTYLPIYHIIINDSKHGARRTAMINPARLALRFLIHLCLSHTGFQTLFQPEPARPIREKHGNPHIWWFRAIPI